MFHCLTVLEIPSLLSPFLLLLFLLPPIHPLYMSLQKQEVESLSLQWIFQESKINLIFLILIFCWEYQMNQIRKIRFINNFSVLKWLLYWLSNKKAFNILQHLSQKMTIYDTFESNEDYLWETVLPTHFWLIT